MDESQIRAARECGSCFRRCGDSLNDKYQNIQSRQNSPSSSFLSDLSCVVENTVRHLMFFTATVAKLREYTN